MSLVCTLTCPLLLLSGVTALVITERPAQMKDILPLSEDLLQRNFAESHTSTQLAKDILLSLSANDDVRQKQFKNAKLEPSSFNELLRTVQEEIQPLKGTMVTLLQRSWPVYISGVATGLPTPAFSYNFETVNSKGKGEGFNVEIRIRPNINVGLWGPGWKYLEFLKQPKGVDWDVETKYRLGFSFQNNGDFTKLMWTAYDCAEWLKMGPGMFWGWTSDVSDSNIRKEDGMAIFGVPAYKFQLYLEIRFVIASRVQLVNEGSKVPFRFGFKVIPAFDRGRNYMTLGYQGKGPTSFWAQWTVFEYEKTPDHKAQFAPVFVGDGDFTKMLGWGMELLIFTSYRAGQKNWYRNTEDCYKSVTSLLGKVINLVCKRLPAKLGLMQKRERPDQYIGAARDTGDMFGDFFGEEAAYNGEVEVNEKTNSACPDKGTWDPTGKMYGHQSYPVICKDRFVPSTGALAIEGQLDQNDRPLLEMAELEKAHDPKAYWAEESRTRGAQQIRKSQSMSATENDFWKATNPGFDMPSLPDRRGLMKRANSVP